MPQAGKPVFLKQKILPVALLVFITALVFSSTLGNGFIWDDTDIVVENSFIRSLSNIPFFFTMRYWKHCVTTGENAYRPARLISFVFDYALWKERAFGYHLTNLLLHAINVLLLYFFIRKLLLLPGDKPAPLNGDEGKGFLFSLPFLAALFFALHPIHTESVAWIKNRSDLLALLFSLISLMYFINFTLPLPVFRRRFAYAVSFACFALAIFSKESSMVLPFIALAYAAYFFKSGRRLWFSLATLPFFALAGLDAWIKLKILSVPLSPNTAAYPNPYVAVLIVIKTIGYYFMLLAAPLGLNAERPFAIPVSFFDGDVLLSFLAIVFFIYAAFRYYARRLKGSVPVLFAIAWLIITLLPAANIVYLQSRPIAEQRLYIPSVGFCLLLAIVAHKAVLARGRLFKRVQVRYLGMVFLAALSVFYASITFLRNFDWKDSLTFWSRTVESSPRSCRAFYNLGYEFVKRNQTKRALEAYHRGWKIDPKDYETRLNLANAYFLQGNFTEAIKHYSACMESNPNEIETYHNLALLYQTAGKTDEAVSYYKLAVEINPYNPVAYSNLIAYYINIEDYQEALRISDDALRLKIESPALFYNRGIALSLANKTQESIDSFKKAVELNPELAEAYSNLAKVYYRQKDYGQAAYYYKKAKQRGIADTGLEMAIRLHNRR